MISVTKTYLPPLREYEKKLKGIWKRGWVTNHGPLVTELERKLKAYLGVKYIFFVSNGTMALQIAYKALGLSGEVITTPFSYVATTSSLVWEGYKPVFADIEPRTLTIDPLKIEKLVTKRTTGIVGVHVYGVPCDVEAIQKIADKNGLKVVYDAAHAFGVKYKGRSILNYGDVSTLSFHATKLFHTVEGGAVVTNDDKIAEKVSYLRNFGHLGKEKPEEFMGLGINGKNSEFHAAMGLCILPEIKKLIFARESLTSLYDRFLSRSGLVRQTVPKETIYNYSYYPVIFSSKNKMFATVKKLNQQGVFPRRYFYPSLNNLEYVEHKGCTISESVSSRVLCLPLYFGLKKSDVKSICKIISAV